VRVPSVQRQQGAVLLARVPNVRHVLDDSTEIKRDKQRIEQLPQGKFFLHAPTAMTVGDKRSIDVRVGVNTPDDVLDGHPRAGNQGTAGPVRISHRMVATLNGAGFKIKPTTPEDQIIAEGFPTVWGWEIKAKSAGNEELETILYVLPAGGSDAPARHWIASHVQKIDVSVKAQTWSEWLKSLSEEVGAINALVIAIGGIGTASIGWFGIHLTRQRKQPPADTTQA
jgi:hypothetical protein